MAHFETTTIARCPIEQATVALRDQLTAVALHLEDVSRIEEIERQVLPDGTLRVVNVWHATATKIPGPLSRLVNPDMLAWTDRAQWSPDGTLCRFAIEPHFMRDSILCQGETRLEPAMRGRGTRISFEGEIEVTRLPALAGLVESFVAEMISGNLGKLGQALFAAGKVAS